MKAHRIGRLAARRGAFLGEALIALVILGGAAVVVAQFATWSLAERARLDARAAAVEATADVIERARAERWADLSAEWAAGQKLPPSVGARWPDARLVVKVEPDPKRPAIKRVTAEVKWISSERAGWRPVNLVALFADRAVEGKK